MKGSRGEKQKGGETIGKLEEDKRGERSIGKN